MIRLALSGDEAAWQRLVEKYRLMVYRLAFRVTYHEEDAMDALQETFSKVATHLSTFQKHSSFRSWITSIAIREAIEVCRKRARAPEPVEQERMEELLAQAATLPGYGPLDQLSREQQILQVHKAAEELSPQQRAILLLSITNDMEPAEIAQELKLPGNQVRSQLARAVARLKVLLNPQKVQKLQQTGADHDNR